MADIDRIAFGLAVVEALEQRDLSYGAAAAAFPGVDKAMLHRACHGHRLSAGNYLLLCRVFEFDPFAYLIDRPRAPLTGPKRPPLTLKDIADQFVTQSVQRETGGISR